MSGHGRSGHRGVDAMPTPLLARAATPYLALSGTANVVMQLARAEVGIGVRDSRVVGARLFDDHERRRRTTIGYLAVAVHGTAAERATYRRFVTTSHAAVRSLPGEEPAYSAFDPDLQLWVGSCLYVGFEQSFEAVHGPLGPDSAAFYAEGVVLGGLLQMPAARWPSDRAAFEASWRSGLAAARIDAATRAYLLRVIRLEYLSRRVPRAVVDLRLWSTTGFLPPELREEMHLPWTTRDERRFARWSARAATLVRRLPERHRGRPFSTAVAELRSDGFLAAAVPLSAEPGTIGPAGDVG